jgi:hypothetical protein
VSGQFLASFWPLRWDGPFLWQLAQDGWRTVAMATAGLTLGFVIAVPLALLAVERLSISRLSGPGGRMAPLPAALRQAARWVAIALRSIPELVWALVFVRVVGLGADGRRAGHRLDLRRHARQGLRRHPGERRGRAGAGAAEERQRPPAGLRLRAAAQPAPPSWPATPSTAGNARSAARWCWASSAPAASARPWTAA